MNTYSVEWGGWDDLGRATVSNVADLDAVLDQVATDAEGHPYKIGIFADGVTFDSLPVGVEVVVGLSDRSSVLYLGPEGANIGYDPTLPAWENGLVWVNANGVPTDYDADRLRLTPEQAREAAREFVRTGKRPTNVQWDE